MFCSESVSILRVGVVIIEITILAQEVQIIRADVLSNYKPTTCYNIYPLESIPTAFILKALNIQVRNFFPMKSV